MKIRRNLSVCEWKGVQPIKPSKGSIVGLAIDSLGDGIIHGLRHNPEGDTNGWYIWGREYSEADNLFKPVCIEHLENYLSVGVLEYLDLPPGFRFLIDGSNYEDVWCDENLVSGK